MSVPVNHENLAEIGVLKRRLYAMSILDIVLLGEEDAWLRVHQKMEEPEGQLDIFAIDNGSGDHLYIVFSEADCIIKGFDHESPYSPHAREGFAVWPGIYGEVPPALLQALEDPALEKETVTFCLWRKQEDNGWSKGTADKPSGGADDGMDYLLGYLCSSAEDYCSWAEDYLEEDVPLPPVRRLYQGEPCTLELIEEINPGRDGKEALLEIQELYKGMI